ncbi:YtxH domain-containing protein [Sabulicella rubraurantiaca]|uniref:YtxH domain-containing protein n=1 Tax=Sabulicella rubraurantiaca TaxID=2811429 RepID=UPI001A95719A|nr:YtxH domain-containing protein [Sabulicella rubraurantiaca]
MDTPTTYGDLRNTAEDKARDLGGKAQDMANDMSEKAQGLARDVGDRAQNLADDARAELAALREKVETLMSERVTPALTQAADQAEATMNAARTHLRDGSERIGERVREQPLLALALAALAGFIVAALVRR